MQFCPDIATYKRFYATGLGRQARMAISQKILSIWPDLAGDTLLGLGYALPYLKPYLRQGKGEVLSFMGSDQGAVYWPRNHANLCALVDETQLPLLDSQLNRMLVVHGLEYSEYPMDILREMWRVLTPGGRAIIVVPHRQSLWSRSEKSIFSHGYPYRTAQLKNMVDEVGFTIVETSGALYFPPLQWKALFRVMPTLEKAGSLLRAQLGGVVIMHIEKQLYATKKATPKGGLLEGVYAPSGKPAMTRDSV